MNKYEILKKIIENGVVAIVRSKTIKEAKEVSEACFNGGINTIEITFSVPGADEVIKTLKSDSYLKDIIVGAGTVLDVTTARIAILAGADFIVGPTFDKEIAFLCNMYKIPYIPGCMTVNEIFEATKYGVDIIKLFPSDQFNPSYIKSIKAPLPQVNFMVTGGINIENVEPWIKNGAQAVGVGGNLTNIKDGNTEAITNLAQKYIEEVKKVRQELNI